MNDSSQSLKIKKNFKKKKKNNLQQWPIRVKNKTSKRFYLLLIFQQKYRKNKSKQFFPELFIYSVKQYENHVFQELQN